MSGKDKVMGTALVVIKCIGCAAERNVCEGEIPEGEYPECDECRMPMKPKKAIKAKKAKKAVKHGR